MDTPDTHIAAKESHDSGSVKELRLALVCYGGSSLAIYMHGVTKELHRLVRASSLLDAPAGGAGSPSVSEDVYRRLLGEMAERDGEGVRTRVVVDVVAGTSAGGINGVCLAKALAHDLSLDGFRDLWFERGDIDGLLAAPRFLPRKLKVGVGGHESVQARAVQGRPDGAVDLRRVRRHGAARGRAGAADADARPAPARALRDGHGLLRLRAAGAVRRPQPDPRHAAPPCARFPLRRRRRP